MIIVLKTTGMELVSIMVQPELGDTHLMDQVRPTHQLQNSIIANIASVVNLIDVFINDDVLFVPHIVNKKVRIGKISFFYISLVRIFGMKVLKVFPM